MDGCFRTATPGLSPADWTLGLGEAAHLWCILIRSHRLYQTAPRTCTLGSDMSIFNACSACNISQINGTHIVYPCLVPGEHSEATEVGCYGVYCHCSGVSQAWGIPVLQSLPVPSDFLSPGHILFPVTSCPSRPDLYVGQSCRTPQLK